MKKQSRIDRYISRYSNQKGQVHIVTGANSGLGLSVTKHLLKLEAHVIMACRNMNKAEEAKEKLIKEFPSANLSIIAFDQADFASIKRFATEIAKKYPHFSSLILNAGIYHPKQGLLTKDGFPLTMGTNYLGVYYLLKCLNMQGVFHPKEEKRIVFVGSLSWYRVKVKKAKAQLNLAQGGAMAQYCRSKTALGALSYFLSRHEANKNLSLGSHVKVLTMHPGVTATNIVGEKNSSFPRFLAKIAPFVLNLFTHHPDVAALGITDLVLVPQVNENHIAVPRGLFHISGYPTLKKYPRNLRENNLALIEETEKIIKL